MVLSLDFQPLSRSFALLPPTLLPGVLNNVPCTRGLAWLTHRPKWYIPSLYLSTTPTVIIDHRCQSTTAHTYSALRDYTLPSSFPMVGLSSADVADVMTRHIPGTSPVYCSLSRIVLPRSSRTLLGNLPLSFRNFNLRSILHHN